MEEYMENLCPKQNLENKKWYKDFINNRNSFFETIHNITNKNN
jgi:hypothetical protein